jgi:hypothetical protein
MPEFIISNVRVGSIKYHNLILIEKYINLLKNIKFLIIGLIEYKIFIFEYNKIDCVVVALQFIIDNNIDNIIIDEDLIKIGENNINKEIRKDKIIRNLYIIIYNIVIINKLLKPDNKDTQATLHKKLSESCKFIAQSINELNIKLCNYLPRFLPFPTTASLQFKINAQYMFLFFGRLNILCKTIKSKCYFSGNPRLVYPNHYLLQDNEILLKDINNVITNINFHWIILHLIKSKMI